MLHATSSSAAEVVVESDVSGSICDAYATHHPRASAYHKRAWLDLIARVFAHDVKCYTALQDGAVAGLLPVVFFRSHLFGRFAVSLPFVNYGGVLADSPSIERALASAAFEDMQRAGGSHLELRHVDTHFSDKPAKRHKVAMTLGLAPTVDEQWNRLDRKVRNQVRKAEKSGLQTQVGGVELVDDFYAVFARNMRDLGTPVYPRRFFAEVATTFDRGSRVVVVSHEGRPVAASLIHWHQQTVEVPWASALREFNPLCANVLLYWRMLAFAIENGFTTFDFGRSTPGEGTFHFKKQWGAEAHDLVWEYWMAGGRPMPDMSPKNPKFSLAITAWQRLPVRVATTLGPMIVRSIP